MLEGYPFHGIHTLSRAGLPAVCQRPGNPRSRIAVTIAAMKQLLLQHVQASIQLKQAFFEQEMERIVAQADDMAERLRRGSRILVCGNGGSAADAQHLAAELSGRYVKERRALAGIALTTDTSALTA